MTPRRSLLTPPGILLFAIALLVLAVQAGLRFAVARERSFDPDEFHHVQRAWLVSEGWTPYVDFYDHHGPLAHLAAAPILALAAPEADAERAADVFRAGRLAGWGIWLLLLLFTFRLASYRGGAELGVVAAVILSGVGMAAAKAIEIRPDGVSLVLWLESLRLALAARGSPWRWIAAGALAGLALSANLKLAVALPALLVPLAFERRRSRGLALLAAGGLAGLAPVGLALAALGATGAFVREALFGSVSGIRTLSPWRFAEELARENPELVVLGLGSLLATLVRLVRARTPRARAPADTRQDARPAEATVVAAAALPMAGVLAIPEPWPQSFLLFLPALAILAAEAALGLASLAAARARAPALRPILLSVFVLALTATAIPRASPSSAIRWDNRGHLAWIRWLVAETPAGATVLAGWGSPAVFRPPATWRPFHPAAWIARMSEDERARVAALVEDVRARPDVVFLDAHLTALSPRIPEAVRRHYTPAGRAGAWLARPRRPPDDGRPPAGIRRPRAPW